MKIQTFQKLQKKTIDVVLLPITLILTIGIFFWQSVWQSHLIVTTLAFTASAIASFYYVTINTIEKPWSYLLKIYKDNKKYKSLGKIKLDQIQQPSKVHPNVSQQTTQDEADDLRSQLNRKQSQRRSMHISFNQQSEKEIEEKPIKRKVSPANHVSNKQPQARGLNIPHAKTTSSNPNAVDIMDLFYFTNQKPLKPQSKVMRPQQQGFDYIDEYTREEQTQKLRKHIEQIVGPQEDLQESLRNEYDQRYNKYKKSLDSLAIDKEIMEKLIFEAKAVVKQKIDEHLLRQFENLDLIDSLLRNNFDVNFRSYKERTSEISSKNIYGSINFVQNTLQGYMPTLPSIQSDKSPFNKKQTIGYQSLGKKLKFSEVLQQCVNLMHTHYFEFDFIGEEGKVNEIKNQLKVLIKQRIELDRFLSLKNSLNLTKNQNEMRKNENFEISSEFEEQRYLNILKLQTLAGILSQRESAQQNLLKQFFSKHHTFSNSEPIDQVNDERNLEILMNFIVKMFREKLSDSGNGGLVHVQLSKPNFADDSLNQIWVKKENTSQTHYDIIYSLKKAQNKINTISEQSVIEKTKQKINLPQTVHCSPGESNIWTCIAFVRLLISKIGLKKEEYPTIKDKELRKDFKRVVEFMK